MLNFTSDHHLLCNWWDAWRPDGILLWGEKKKLQKDFNFSIWERDNFSESQLQLTFDESFLWLFYSNQNCGIAQPSAEAESLAHAAELWHRTERELGISWPGHHTSRVTMRGKLGTTHLKILTFSLFSLRLKTTNLPILNLHKARQEWDTKVKQTCSQ